MRGFQDKTPLGIWLVGLLALAIVVGGTLTYPTGLAQAQQPPGSTPTPVPRPTNPTLPRDSLTESLCMGEIPGCPQVFLFVLPLIAVAILLSMGVRNPVVLSGVVTLVLAATSIAINPNVMMLGLIVLGALAVGAGAVAVARR